MDFPSQSISDITGVVVLRISLYTYATTHITEDDLFKRLGQDEELETL